MHTLSSSGYTLSGIYIDDLRTFLNLHHSAYKSIGFGRCAHPRKKKVVLSAFLVVIHQTKKENGDSRCGSPPGVKMADTLSFTAKVDMVDF